MFINKNLLFIIFIKIIKCIYKHSSIYHNLYIKSLVYLSLKQIIITHTNLKLIQYLLFDCLFRILESIHLK